MLQQFLQARDLQKLLPPLRCGTVSILLTVFPMLSKTCLHLLKICYASFRSKLISIGLLPIDKTFDTVNFFYQLRCSPSPWCFILAIQFLRKFNMLQLFSCFLCKCPNGKSNPVCVACSCWAVDVLPSFTSHNFNS